jgi:hypothetical protein
MRTWRGCGEGVSYIFAGKSELDFMLALDIFNRELDWWDSQALGGDALMLRHRIQNQNPKATRLPTYRFSTRKRAMIGVWFVVMM